MSVMPMLRRGQACSECRRRKLRCDGEKPACSVCILANRECQYIRPVTRPISVVLQERLTTLEAEYARLTAETQPGPARRAATQPWSDATPTDLLGAAPSQLVGSWWESEELAPPVRDHLLGIFMENSPRIFFWMHGATFSARLASPDPQTQPHRALLESIYLMACYFASHPSASSSENRPSQSSLAAHEAHFLDRARIALRESLSYSDRLVDFLRGSVLVTTYLFLRGLYIEGYHANCGTATFAVSCGLNRITSHVFRADHDLAPTASSGSSLLLDPPVSQVDLGERILAFWNIFAWDKVASIVTGFLSALPSEGNLLETIETVFPKTLGDYATGRVTDLTNESIRDLLEPERALSTPSQVGDVPRDPYVTNLKALLLLERAMRLAGNYRARPSNDARTSIQKHLAATLHFASTLLIEPSADTGWSSQTADRYMSSVMALGALMEIYNTQADVDLAYYDERLARARELADLTSRIPSTAYVNHSFSSIGYCGRLAVQVILNHIQQLQVQDTQTPEGIQEAKKCEESLAYLLEALSHFGAANPGHS